MLDQLSRRTLEQRRADARLCLFYKMIHGIVAVPLPDYVQPTHRVSRYCHSMTFRQIHTNRNYHKYSFVPLTIVQWNALPESVVSLQDLEAFKVAAGEQTATLKTLDPDTVVFNLILISSSLFLTYHLLFPLTIMLLFFFPFLLTLLDSAQLPKMSARAYGRI